MSPGELIQEIQTKYPSIGDVQHAIAFLKENGYDRADTIAVIHRVYGLSPNESKSIVHNSITWGSDKAAVEKLHELFDHDLSDSGERSS